MVSFSCFGNATNAGFVVLSGLISSLSSLFVPVVYRHSLPILTCAEFFVTVFVVFVCGHHTY